MDTPRIDDMRPRLSLDASEFQRAIIDSDRLAKGFAASLADAFIGLTAKGKSLGEVVSQIGLRLSKIALTSAFKPLEKGLTTLLEQLGAGLGGVARSAFSGAPGAPMPLLPFAKGGVVAAPSYFPMSGAMGLMGERGAEAILPLARGPDGALGVRAAGGGGGAVTVHFNVTTPDVEGFRRSEAEITATLARMVGRGRRGT